MNVSEIGTTLILRTAAVLLMPIFAIPRERAATKRCCVRQIALASRKYIDSMRLSLRYMHVSVRRERMVVFEKAPCLL